MKKTMVRQAVPLQLTDVHGGADIRAVDHGGPWWSRYLPAAMEVHGGTDIHLQSMKDPALDQVEVLEGGCDPGATLCWSRLLAVPVDMWGERSPCWSRFASRACDPMGHPHWSSLFLKDCNPWNGPMLEQSLKNCRPWEVLTLEKFVRNCLS